MAPISALTYDNAQHIFDDIDRHFQLNQETLVELSNAFLDEFRAGLGNYNHPMAMMYVLSSTIFTHSDRISSPTFVTGVPDGTETG
jgi:hexokinase